jgi:hypothetical protein
MDARTTKFKNDYKHRVSSHFIVLRTGYFEILIANAKTATNKRNSHRSISGTKKADDHDVVSATWTN